MKTQCDLCAPKFALLWRATLDGVRGLKKWCTDREGGAATLTFVDFAEGWKSSHVVTEPSKEEIFRERIRYNCACKEGQYRSPCILVYEGLKREFFRVLEGMGIEILGR